MQFSESISLPALLAIAGTIAGVVIAAIRLSMRMGVLEFKVGTMWNFQMRRGFSEVVQSGIGSFGSPLTFNPEIESALDPIRDRLIEFGKQKLNNGIDDSNALLLIEAMFGDELLNLVCVPCGLSHAACLLLALTVAKASNEIRLAKTGTAPSLAATWFARFARFALRFQAAMVRLCAAHLRYRRNPPG